MKSPSEAFLNDRPYDSYEEYLGELSVLLNLKIQAYLKENKGDYCEEKPVLLVLSGKLNRAGITGEQDVEAWEERIEDRLEMTKLAGDYFALEYVVSKMGMDGFGRMVLALALLASLDYTYRGVFQYLNEDEKKSHPTLELCGRIFREPGQSVFDMYNQIYGRIRDYRILFPGINVENQYMTRELVCDERLLDILLGKNRCIPAEIEIIEGQGKDPLWFRETEMQALESFVEDKKFPIFLILGERGAGKKQLVRYFAQNQGMELVLFDGSVYDRMEEEGYERLTKALQYAVRECVLWTMPLAIQGIDGFEQNLTERFLIYLKDELQGILQLIFVLSCMEKYSPETGGIYVLPLGRMNEQQRIQLWNHYREGYLLEENISIEELANTFSLTPGQIKEALQQASISSGGHKKPITRKILYQACYSRLHHQLAEKTEKISPGFTWDDLKMDRSDKQILKDICNCVRNRHTVMTTWNFSRVVPYGAGITVLFSGPPGTGKTMAAQVLANELQMELYKIDLSRMMDKYVGETEKNIKGIFEQAKKSNSILFFDEADAIFNKRLEASGANERFANIESSLLLQCVEAYSGISILATNYFQSIDAAFIRRFKYYILFREPDEATRYEIWRSVFPAEAPLAEDVDLHLLAHLFEFTGAIIKNIALAAAYLAADRQRAISNVDILRAARREMQKVNLALTKEKLGSLGYLFEEIID